MKLRIGIVGLGYFSDDFIKLFKMHPDVEEVAVCDLLPERVEASMAKHKLTKSFLSYEEMLKDKSLNCIGVFTQRHLHAKMVLDALDAGKHVYSAVPIACTVEEIGTLIGPSDLVGTYLTNEDVEAGNAVQIPYLADTFWENNQFVGSIAKIKTTNYTRDFVARGYIKVDGVYYYSATTATRNVRFVADAYIADENSDYATLDNAAKAVVDKFATPKA